MLADMIISQEEEAYHIAAGNSLNVHPSSSSELIRLEEADRNQQVAPSTAELMKLPRQERLNRLEVSPQYLDCSLRVTGIPEEGVPCNLGVL